MTTSHTPTDTDTDLAAELRIVIGRLGRRLRPTATGTSEGLTPTRVALLFAIVRDGPMRLADLAEAEGMNPTMLSRSLGKLVDAGLAERTSDPEDRRSAWVAATVEGRRVTERMRRERTDAVKLALDALPDADRRHIDQALPALQELAERLHEGAR